MGHVCSGPTLSGQLNAAVFEWLDQGYEFPEYMIFLTDAADVRSRRRMASRQGADGPLQGQFGGAILSSLRDTYGAPAELARTPTMHNMLAHYLD